MDCKKMKNPAPRSRRTFSKVLGYLAIFALALNGSAALAAANFACTMGGPGGDVPECYGSEMTPTTDYTGYYSATDACAASTAFTGGSTMTDGSGNWAPNGGTVPAGTWYFYATSDACSTSIPDTNNPHVIAASAVCGNGAVESGEACDDGNTADGDGCSAACAVESGWSCGGDPSNCAHTGFGVPDAFFICACVGTALALALFRNRN